jgi:hypothetical protein
MWKQAVVVYLINAMRARSSSASCIFRCPAGGVRSPSRINGEWPSRDMFFLRVRQLRMCCDVTQ